MTNSTTPADMKRLVALRIEDLPHDEQMILQMYHVERMSFHEIARVLLTLEADVRKKFARATAKCLAPRQKTPLDSA